MKENHQEEKSLRYYQKLHKFLLYLLITLIVIFLVLLNFYYGDLYKKIYYLIKFSIEQRNYKTYLYILGLNSIFQMFFVPGISFFCIYLGYVTNDYLYGMFLCYTTTLIITAVIYFITSFTIKNWLKNKLQNKWYFEMYYQESKKKPWKISTLLRVMLIPITYKNYIIALMNINFWQYFIPSIFFYLVYLSMYILIGMVITNLQDLFNNKIPTQNKKVFYFFLSITISLAVLSLFIMSYFVVLTIRSYKKFKAKVSKKEHNELLNNLNC